ncbi:KRAB-A domain-containing protein 2-like [Scylla paramamosain]|uniref:KRAB-A domain-containing protein 2-like n=1 Tax=Scylla paramamosain TaxID=85552 RepID=UPI003083D56F
MNSRAQVDLIDMQSQPDGKHRFILNYQDHLTKMVCLPGSTDEKLLKRLLSTSLIYSVTKEPPISCSLTMEEEFSNKLVKEVLMMWPECKMVHGKPRHSQSQGSVERANRDIEAILACWMLDCALSSGRKNTRFHSGIGRTPYEAMYGQKARLGVDANFCTRGKSWTEREVSLREVAIAESMGQEAKKTLIFESVLGTNFNICFRKLDINNKRLEQNFNRQK